MPFWIRRPSDVATAPDIDGAYNRGRADERAARKRHPIIMALLFVLAAVGAFLIGLAAYNGSFSDGGEVADQSLNRAATNAAPVVEDAMARTGEAARDAGDVISDTSRDLVQPRQE